MSSMREVVSDRLSRMEDLEQRRLLKQIVSGVFMNLVDYQEQMNRRLEQRIFDEVEQEEDKYDVYVTVCPRDELDPVHPYLFPMIPEDVHKKSIDMHTIADGISHGREVTLTTLFLECRHELLRPLWTKHRTFQGEIQTTLASYEVQVQLRPNRIYVDEVEKLYHLFRSNHLPWRTVNHPYAAKFFDVVLVGSSGGYPLSPEEDLVEIVVHLEEFEAYKRSDMVPLWNIEPLYLKTIGFPSPAWDKVNYEHVFSIRKSGTQHGYLVDAAPEYIRYIKHGAYELTVVSPKEKADVWRLLKVVRPSSLDDRPAASYELVSNRRDGGFTDAYIRQHSPVVRTKGEILRIISLLEDYRLQLVDIRVADASEGHAVTYDMNPFIDDRVRTKAGRARLRLMFRYAGTEPASFLIDDWMSFLVSEVQLYFPEYVCEGEWA